MSSWVRVGDEVGVIYTSGYDSDQHAKPYIIYIFYSLFLLNTTLVISKGPDFEV